MCLGNPRKIVPVEEVVDEENYEEVPGLEGIVEEDYVDYDDDYCKLSLMY